MGEFTREIEERMREALAALEQARASDDTYAVSVSLGEIDSLARLAADNDVFVAPLATEDAVTRTVTEDTVAPLGAGDGADPLVPAPAGPDTVDVRDVAAPRSTGIVPA